MSRAIAVLVLVSFAILSPARAAEPAPATLFSTRLAAALHARDAAAAAELFTPDADATLIGAGTAHGRAAVAQAIATLLAAYPSARVTVGRSWVSPRAAVVEWLLTGTRAAGTIRGRPVAARRVGLAAAAVISFTGDGRARTFRLYADAATLLGQIAPQLLPEGMRTRPVAAQPPAGSAVAIARGTADEARHLAVTNAVWAALDAHHAADVMAPAAAGYVYEDFSGPAPLDKAATQKLVADFVTTVQGFVIADKPMQLAAGDDVITEMVEHASFAGRPITLHGLDIKRFADGHVVHEWQYANYAEVMTQLLHLDAPPPF